MIEARNENNECEDENGNMSRNECGNDSPPRFVQRLQERDTLNHINYVRRQNHSLTVLTIPPEKAAIP